MPDHPIGDTPDPEATLRESVWSVSVDAADLARRLPGDDASARVLDKLAEELAEAAQLRRSLPARPVPISGHDVMLLTALRSAHAAGEDVAETIARACARLAAELGGTEAVLSNREGSWEASHIRDLLDGTIGADGEGLGMYRGPGGPGGSL
jgi:hypothetical protein